MRAHVALQFELAMGLTSTLDGEALLQGFVRTLLRRLSLRGVAAFARTGAGDALTRVVATPQRFLVEFSPETARALRRDDDAVALPPEDLGDGSFRQRFSLPRFGALVVDRHEAPLPALTVGALLPLLTRCGHLLQASSERAERIRHRALEEERAAQHETQQALLQALREERDRLDALLSSSSAILYSGTFPEGRVDFVSRSGEEILGFSLEEFQRPGFWADALHPEDRPRVMATVAQALAGTDRYVNEFRHRHADGGYLWLRDHVRIVRDAGGAPARVVGASFDITNRKRVERRIESLLGLQRVVVELSSAFLRNPVDTYDLAVSLSLQGLGELIGAQRAYVFRVEGETVSNTHEWCAAGVTPEIANLQGLPMAAFSFFIGSLREQRSLYIPSVAAMPEALAAERDFLAAQRIERVLVVSMSRDGALTGFVGLDNPAFEPLEPGDVTDLLRLYADELVVGLRNVEERSLREDLLRAVVEKHHALTALNEHLEARVRERTMQLAESDARFEHLFEHAPQAILVVDAKGVAQRANLRAGTLFGCAPEALIGHALHAPGSDGPVWLDRRDGGGFWAEVHRVPMVLGGERREMLGIADVSDRERQRRAVEKELREKETLLQEVHHRVKNNLQIVSSLLMLQRSRVSDPALRDVLEESVGRVRSMALVHQQLYAESGPARIDIAAYAQTLSQSLRATLTSTARIAVEAEPGVSLSTEHAVPLGLILNELLTNAIKHGIPAEGASPEGTWDVRVGVTHEGGSLRVVVENRGRPLPDSVDWRTAPTLGLHLVRSLARQIRASLEVTAHPWTCFTLRIPASP